MAKIAEDVSTTVMNHANQAPHMVAANINDPVFAAGWPMAFLIAGSILLFGGKKRSAK